MICVIARSVQTNYFGQIIRDSPLGGSIIWQRKTEIENGYFVLVALRLVCHIDGWDDGKNRWWKYSFFAICKILMFLSGSLRWFRIGDRARIVEKNQMNTTLVRRFNFRWSNWTSESFKCISFHDYINEQNICILWSLTCNQHQDGHWACPDYDSSLSFIFVSTPSSAQSKRRWEYGYIIIISIMMMMIIIIIISVPHVRSASLQFHVEPLPPPTTLRMDTIIICVFVFVFIILQPMGLSRQKFSWQDG